MLISACSAELGDQAGGGEDEELVLLVEQADEHAHDDRHDRGCAMARQAMSPNSSPITEKI